MDQSTALPRFRELQAYVELDGVDVQRLQACAPLLAPSFLGIVEDFYRQIDRHPEARKSLTGGEAQRERLKSSLADWLRDLFCGRYDEAYVSRRWSVGLRHAEIGLDLVYYNVAMARIRNGLLDRLHRAWTGDPAELWATARAINALLDLDLAIVGDAYQRESLARVQRVERLATLGQIARGVEHELRNPLNVIRTSVYYLRHAPQLSREKQDQHLLRIDRHIEEADRVVSELYDFARMPVPQPRPVAVAAIIRNLLLDARPPERIEATTEGLDALPRAFADPEQIGIVFRNLIRNACEAMPGDGALRILGETLGDGLEISFVDGGPGIPHERLGTIMEPFYTTKPRGLGLGLAVARSILEKNDGQLRVTSEVGRGSTFVVRLPIANDLSPDPEVTSEDRAHTAQN